MAAGEVQRSPRGVGVAGGQAADLGVRSGVQQREQAGEPFVRMGGVIGPSPEQRPLDGGIKDVAGKGRLAAQPQGDRRVDEDELAALRPAEEAARRVCSLVAVAVGAVAEECFQVVVVTRDQPVTGPADVRWTARSRKIRSLVSRVVSLTGAAGAGLRPALRAGYAG